jgi:hypothetical protein
MLQAGTQGWTWSDAIIFIVVIASLQLAMFWLLTTVFLGMITEGDRCPVCDGDTHAVERNGWWRVISFGERNRRSWCVTCGWEGLLRRSDAWVARERERRRAWRQAHTARTDAARARLRTQSQNQTRSGH